MIPPSHSYDFDARTLLRVLGLPLLWLGLFALLMQSGAAARIWPKPRPALDTDRTILFHQAEAARQPHSTEVLLIGDSSCLMDVSAPQLTALSGGAYSALNLGTLSYLDLRAFATMLAAFSSSNQGQPKLVVLLMNPEALRRPSPYEYTVDALRHFYGGTDYCSPETPPVLCLLGVEIFRGRFWSRAAPVPLAGRFGRSYGFTHDLWEYLSRHRGSAVDPGRFDAATAQGNAEYRLAGSLEAASASFRAAVPAGARLAVGITPLPRSFAGLTHPQVYQRLLSGWNQWIQADQVLSNLPSVLPDHLFASATHLNPEGIRIYTRQLSQELKPRFAPPGGAWRSPPAADAAP